MKASNAFLNEGPIPHLEALEPRLLLSVTIPPYFDGDIDLNTAAGTSPDGVVRILGDDASDESGYSVSSAGDVNGDDYDFFRFTTTAAGFLCDDDVFEENDSSGAAHDFGMRTSQATWVNPRMCDHYDWYKFTTAQTGGSTDDVTITFTHGSVSDLNLFVYGSDATTLLGSSGSTTDNETVSLDGAPAGTYYVMVSVGLLAFLACPSYSLTIDPPPPLPPDDAFEPNDISVAAHGFGMLTSPLTRTSLRGYDDDWFRFTTIEMGDSTDDVTITFSDVQGNLDLYVYESDATTLWGGGNSSSDNETVSLDGAPAGMYYVQVDPFGSAMNPNYSLTIDPPWPLDDVYDSLPGNDTSATAHDFGILTSPLWRTSLRGYDDDWFKFTTMETGGTTDDVTITFSDVLGDLNLYVYESDARTLLGSSTSTTDDETVSLDGAPAGTYYVWVAPFGVAPLGSPLNPDYFLTIDPPWPPDDVYDSLPGNDTSATAHDFGMLTRPLTRTSLRGYNDDWFKFTTMETGGTTDDVTITFSDVLGDLNLYVYESDATTLLGSSTSTTDDETVSLDGAPAGTYYVQVAPFGSALNPNYSLTIDPPWPPDDVYDSLPGNDTSATAHDFGMLTRPLTGTSLRGYDDDWFKFTTMQTGGTTDAVTITFSDAQGDLNLAVYRWDHMLMSAWGSSTSTTDDETVSLYKAPAGTYYVWVDPVRSALNANYSLTIDPPWPPDDVYDSLPGNDTSATAHDFGMLTSPLTRTSLRGYDDDWYKFTTIEMGGTTDDVTITFSDVLGDLNLYVYESDATTLWGSSGSTTDDEMVSLFKAPAGTYYVSVDPVRSALNPNYSLMIDPPPGSSSVPDMPNLMPGSDTGIPDDDITNRDNDDGRTLQFEVTATVDGATVRIYADGMEIGSAAATGETTTVTTNGSYDLIDGIHLITATQQETNKAESAPSGSLEVTVNTVPPVADAGGPYVVDEGGSITLDGTGSFDPDDSIAEYEWDFDYDGVTFDIDATGATLLFDASSLDGPLSRTVALLVRDTSGNTSNIDITTVTVNNVAPILSLDPVAAIYENGQATLTGTIVDPGPLSPAPQVRNLAFVDEMIAGSRGRTVATAKIDEADIFDDAGGHWTYYNNPVPGGGGNDYAIVGTGTLQVNTAGVFSFAISGDDGGRLRIDDVDVIVDDSTHPFQDRFGEATLSAGAHTFEWVGFERGSWAGWELSVAVGSKSGPVNSQNGWKVVGDPSPHSEIQLQGIIDVTAYYSVPPENLTLTVDWGEGSPEVFNLGASRSFSVTHRYLDDNPTGTATDDYTINTTVTDDDAGVGTDSAIVTVNNVAPVIPWYFCSTPDRRLAYFNNFDAPPTMGPGVTGLLTLNGAREETVHGFATLGAGTFAGEFLRNPSGGNPAGKTTLTLEGLAPHTSIDVNFLAAIIDSWDGDTELGGLAPPDYFNVEIDGSVIFSETFDYLLESDQSYEPAAGVQLTPFPLSNLGFNGNSPDAAYDLGRDPTFDNIPHTEDTLTISWYASGGGWQAGWDESWAIEDVEVILNHTGRVLNEGNDTVTLTGTFDDPGVLDTHTATVNWGDGTSEIVAIFDDYSQAPGTIVAEYWTGIRGARVTNLTNDPNYPDNPSGSEQLSSFEWHTDWANNYGTRVRGYVHPAVTGNYVFWIASDNNSELWLSTDDDPGNKQLIAFVAGWTNSRQWDKYAPQESAQIYLEAGQRYYIETLQKEGGGGDNLAVRWMLPGGTWEDPADPSNPIPGKRISPFFGPPTHTTDTLTHTYDDNGVFTVTLTVEDDDTGSDSDSTTVTVNNVAPTIDTFTVPATGNEGTAIAVSATASDPAGANDTLSFDWTVLKDGAAFAAGAGASFSFTPDDDDAYQVNLEVSDEDGGLATSTATVNVSNVAPTATVTGPTEWVPGAPLALTLGAADPSPDDQAAGFAYRVDWGDGTVEAVAGPDGTQITHAYDMAGLGRGLELLSVGVDGGSGDGESYFNAITPDGRYVAFNSIASNLVPGDTPGSMDVFVCDRVTGQTERIGGALQPAISDDGRYVAFRSEFPPYEIFLYDRQTGQATLVSVAPDGAPADDSSDWPSISADGRYVAFVSDASNLVPDDNNRSNDVFVYDRLTEAIRRVSVAADGSEGNWGSNFPSISADGRYVGFTSYADNLLPAGDANGQEGDVFLHDRDADEDGLYDEPGAVALELVSVASDGTQGNRGSNWPSISADGRYVVFDSYASNLVAGDTNDSGDIFVRDRWTGQTELVSVALDGGLANSASYWTSISADGRYVGFCSYASNLVEGDVAGQWDIFLHDRATGRTERVNVAPDGSEGNDMSGLIPPGISAAGDVVFTSLASNLAPDDDNGTYDVFISKPSSFAVAVTATDKDGGESAPVHHEVGIVPATVAGDDVLVGGTGGDDDIGVGSGSVVVTINGVEVGHFDDVTGRIIVYGLGGDDTITVAPDITLASELYGGDGNDTLTGGGGDNILNGGAGDDVLVGGTGTNVIIGGGGSNTFVDGGGQNTFETAPGSTTPEVFTEAYEIDEDTALAVAAPLGVLANDVDPLAAALQAVLVSGPSHGSLTLNADGSFTYTPAQDYNGPDSFTYRAANATDQSSEATVTITVYPVNDGPTVGADSGPVTVNEGDAAQNTGSFGDVDRSDNVTITASIGTVTQVGTQNGTWSWSFPATDGPDDSQAVTITATDSDGDATSTTFDLVVNNVAPEAVIVSIVDDAGQAIGTDTGWALVGLDVALTGSFSDAGAVDTHSATINWGDGNVIDLGVVDPSEAMAATHAYAAAGTYTITLTVTDDDGGVGTETFEIAVLDPAEAIQEVADELGDLANNPDISPRAAAAVTDALEELEGKNGGKSASGALDKIEAGDTNAAFVKMTKAIRDLEDAEAADPALDLSPLKRQLALIAKSLSVAVVALAETLADPDSQNDPRQITWAYEDMLAGQASLDANEFEDAVDSFLDALMHVNSIK